MNRGIGYTVIGGYLGAGKTTLINNLLRDSGNLRLAVLVNDFGDISIDAELIASHDGETIQLASGCICCSLADGFMMALNQMSKRRDQIDHVVVEASGVSDPLKIGQYGAILRLELNGVIVLADAEQIREKAANKYVGDTVIRQLQGADLLVLNKVDLVGPEELAALRAWLLGLAPDLRIIATTYGQVPLAVLFGAHGDKPTDSHNKRHVRVDRAGDEAGQHAHQAMYETRSLTCSEPIQEADLRSLVSGLPAGVLRAKGFVHLAEDPEHRYLLQLVGKRWQLTSGEPWGDAPPETRLVFIGLPGSTRPLSTPLRATAVLSRHLPC
jgi:G3E family GTPase